MERTPVPDDAQDLDLPTVLMFRPTKYTVVPSERLEEWERIVQERAGVSRRPSGTICYSWCGDVIFDDCDEL